MTWFVDKLGPAPARGASVPFVDLRERTPPGSAKAQPAAQAQRTPAAAPPPAAAPEPEKKKKKGWF